MRIKVIDIINSIPAIIDEENTSPDAFICPICDEVTIEGKGITQSNYNRFEIMRVIKHTENCMYIKAIEDI